MSKENVFEGWVGLDKESVHGKLEWQRYDPKTFDEDDVEIAIMYCGVCGASFSRLYLKAWRTLTALGMIGQRATCTP